MKSQTALHVGPGYYDAASGENKLRPKSPSINFGASAKRKGSTSRLNLAKEPFNNEPPLTVSPSKFGASAKTFRIGEKQKVKIL